jgi:hypothetical protein
MVTKRLTPHTHTKPIHPWLRYIGSVCVCVPTSLSTTFQAEWPLGGHLLVSSRGSARDNISDFPPERARKTSVSSVSIIEALYTKDTGCTDVFLVRSIKQVALIFVFFFPECDT